MAHLLPEGCLCHRNLLRGELIAAKHSSLVFLLEALLHVIVIPRGLKRLLSLGLLLCLIRPEGPDCLIWRGCVLTISACAHTKNQAQQWSRETVGDMNMLPGLGLLLSSSAALCSADKMKPLIPSPAGMLLLSLTIAQM